MYINFHIYIFSLDLSLNTRLWVQFPSQHLHLDVLQASHIHHVQKCTPNLSPQSCPSQTSHLYEKQQQFLFVCFLRPQTLTVILCSSPSFTSYYQTISKSYCTYLQNRTWPLLTTSIAITLVLHTILYLDYWNSLLTILLLPFLLYSLFSTQQPGWLIFLKY